MLAVSWTRTPLSSAISERLKLTFRWRSRQDGAGETVPGPGAASSSSWTGSATWRPWRWGRARGIAAPLPRWSRDAAPVTVSHSASRFGSARALLVPVAVVLRSFRRTCVHHRHVRGRSHRRSHGRARRRVLHPRRAVRPGSRWCSWRSAPRSARGTVLLDYRDWIRRIGGVLIVIFGSTSSASSGSGCSGGPSSGRSARSPRLLRSLAVGITRSVGRLRPILARSSRSAVGDASSAASPARRLLRLGSAAVPGLGGGARPVPQLLQTLRPFIPVVERAPCDLVVVGCSCSRTNCRPELLGDLAHPTGS